MIAVSYPLYIWNQGRSLSRVAASHDSLCPFAAANESDVMALSSLESRSSSFSSHISGSNFTISSCIYVSSNIVDPVFNSIGVKGFFRSRSLNNRSRTSSNRSFQSSLSPNTSNERYVRQAVAGKRLLSKYRDVRIRDCFWNNHVRCSLWTVSKGYSRHEVIYIWGEN